MDSLYEGEGMDERPEWRAWHGWLMVAAWALMVAVLFWFLVAPPWGDAGPVEAPTTMGARR